MGLSSSGSLSFAKRKVFYFGCASGSFSSRSVIRRVSSFCFAFSFSESASTIIPLCLLFLGPLITLVRVKGEALGHSSSSGQVPFTPARKHSLVIVAG